MIPERLRINGRPAVQDFDADEKLYRQVEPAYIPWTKENLHHWVDFPTCVARSQFCDEPTDVFYSYGGSGKVAYWVHGRIPASLSHEIETPHEIVTVFLRVCHCPENDFYPHCEITMHRSADALEQWKPTAKTVKYGIRYQLAQLAELIDDDAEQTALAPT